MTLFATGGARRASNHINHDLAVVFAAGCTGAVRYTEGATIATDRTSGSESVVTPALT